jgi:hypothetical protein
VVLAAFFYVTFVIAALLSKQAGGRLKFIDPALYLNATVNKLEVLSQWLRI